MPLYAATIALSAFLLFLVQPLIARQILPWFGGSAAVWTTCLVFFQVALLAGYFYSDVVVRRLPPRGQAALHTALLLASLAVLPITPAEGFKPADAGHPVVRILTLLTVTIGLPYLMLATTGPLVQAWFSRRFEQARVYRLYALSNAASMLALVAYPPLIEPNASSRAQSVGWSVAYAVFALMAIAAAWLALRTRAAAAPAPTAGEAARSDVVPHPTGGMTPDPTGGVTPDPTGGAHAGVDGARPSWRNQALWMALAALGSVLLLAVTTHITQNVASVPFLWVLPLAIYLVTFILCFDGRGWYWRPQYLLLAPLLAVAMLAGLSFRPTGAGVERAILHIDYAVTLYGFGLFVLCMFLHGELVARKPPAGHLTRFYLMVSLGGAAGGLLVGVVAPLLFEWYWEFPLALAATAALAAALATGGHRAVAVAATLACAALLFDYVRWIHDDVIELSRSFYGTLRVKEADADDPRLGRRRLLHGVILHGEQFLNPEWRGLSTTYYGPSSGIGRTIDALRASPQRVGLIGLGVGTLAAYGRDGDVYRLYELDPAVLDIAQRRFTFLTDSAARIEPALGDARLVLERESPQRFDVLAVDAFSSDSIPVHLITREAMQLYRRHLSPQGAVAFHISNRYLDLTGVVRQLADDAGMQAIRIVDDPGDASYLYRSDWIVVTANPVLADALTMAGGTPAPTQPRLRPWTDDHHNLFDVLK